MLIFCNVYILCSAGLTGEVVVDGKSLDNWEIFPLDFKKAMNKRLVCYFFTIILIL